jgi:hypothetical protein
VQCVVVVCNCCVLCAGARDDGEEPHRERDGRARGHERRAREVSGTRRKGTKNTLMLVLYVLF